MNGAPAFIVGNTVAEPELRFTTAGIPWVTFDVDLPHVQGKPTGETKLISGGKPVNVLPPTPADEDIK